jgi:microcystin-dependent protein
MSQPFMAQIMMVSFNFAPKGWSLCNGQLLAINQNQALFSLLGTTYGGNGQTTFALPNLQGRIPNGFGANYTLGELGGVSSVTVNIPELPAHNHIWNANNTLGSSGIDANNVLGGGNMYTPSPLDSTMLPAAVSSVGGSQAHTNMMPYLVLNYCIALQGIFPSQN